MPHNTSSSQLQKKLIVFSSAGIFLISIAVAIVSILPLYKQLIREQEKNLSYDAKTTSMAIEEFLTRSRDIANQITSRTRIRQKLDAYNDGKISLEELLPFTKKGLGDALSGSEEVFGITRLDKNGLPVLQLGTKIPSSFWPVPANDNKAILIKGPVKLEDDSYLVLGAPILEKNSKRIGTDIVLFSIDKLRRIISDSSGLGETGETVVGFIKTDLVFPLIPMRHNTTDQGHSMARNSDLARAIMLAVEQKSGLIKSSSSTEEDYVIAFRPIKDSKWGLAVKVDKHELYKVIQHKITITSVLILCLIFAGTLGMIFLLRPLAGKVILHTSELEQNIMEKTSSLQEKEARISSIVENAVEGIITINEIGIIELFNPAAERIFGYKAAEIINKNVNELMPEPYRHQHNGYLETYLCTGKKRILGTGGREVEGMRKDGSLFPMELSISELDIKGQKKYTGLIRDITERKLAQEELNQRYKELKKVNENLHSAQSQLLQSEKMASVGQLAAGVAHEINNPVGYINSNVSTLKQYIADLLRVLDGYERLEKHIPDEMILSEVHSIKADADLSYLKEDILELMDESQEGITRVKQIVQDLKDFSHVDEAEWQWVDLHKGLDSTLNVAHNETKYKAKIVRQYGEIPQVECMPSQINQVFMNLIVNAAHAIQERGIITISTGTDNEQVWIAVNDTGKGMSEEVQKRIFEPFYTTKPVGKGTGLGLSLSYGIIENHGGRIELESEEGKGTTFTIWLPLKQSKIEDEG